jgi:hypothetical protein
MTTDSRERLPKESARLDLSFIGLTLESTFVMIALDRPTNRSAHARTIE